MRVLVLGVTRSSGISKASGKPFDFTQMAYVVPVQPYNSETFNKAGFGYEVPTDTSKKARTLDCTIELSKLSRVNFPVLAELTTESTMDERGQMKQVVTNLTPVPVAPAVPAAPAVPPVARAA